MGMPVLIYGKSGSGKSRSLKNFAEDEIFLINVCKKPLPFRKKFKYEIATDDFDKIKRSLLKSPTKVSVIDDSGYLMTNKFMNGHSAPKQGTKTFDLYNDIADSFWKLIMFVKDEIPNDTIVYFILHEQTNDYGDTKLRTIGKLLDEKVCIEGMVTISLRCVCEETHHYFKTQTDGNDITKAPEEMFKESKIENDLKSVDTAIREYYEMNGDNKNE